MKNLIILASCAMLFTSCGTYQQPAYIQTQPVVVQQPQQVMVDQNGYEVLQQGGQQVVYIHNGMYEGYMEMALFNSLYYNGGWGSVWGTYRSNPSRYYNTTVVNHYHNYSSTGQSYSIGKDNKPVKAQGSYWSNKTANRSSSSNNSTKPSSSSWSNSTSTRQTTNTPSQSTQRQVYRPSSSTPTPSASTRSVYRPSSSSSSSSSRSSYSPSGKRH